MLFLSQIQMETALESLVDKLGLPVVILVAIALAAWKAAKWWAPIIKDWGERFIGSHEKLVNSAVQIGESNSRTLESQAVTLKSLTETMKNGEATMEELRKTQLEMHAANQRQITQSTNPPSS